MQFDNYHASMPKKANWKSRTSLDRSIGSAKANSVGRSKVQNAASFFEGLQEAVAPVSPPCPASWKKAKIRNVRVRSNGSGRSARSFSLSSISFAAEVESKESDQGPLPPIESCDDSIVEPESGSFWRALKPEGDSAETGSRFGASLITNAGFAAIDVAAAGGNDISATGISADLAILPIGYSATPVDRFFVGAITTEVASLNSKNSLISPIITESSGSPSIFEAGLPYGSNDSSPSRSSFLLPLTQKGAFAFCDIPPFEEAVANWNIDLHYDAFLDTKSDIAGLSTEVASTWRSYGISSYYAAGELDSPRVDFDSDANEVACARYDGFIGDQQGSGHNDPRYFTTLTDGGCSSAGPYVGIGRRGPSSPTNRGNKQRANDTNNYIGDFDLNNISVTVKNCVGYREVYAAGPYGPVLVRTIRPKFHRSTSDEVRIQYKISVQKAKQRWATIKYKARNKVYRAQDSLKTRVEDFKYECQFVEDTYRRVKYNVERKLGWNHW